MKTENLEDAIKYPLLVLALKFQKALQSENFEICEKIKTEMDRRKKNDEIDKKSLNDILSFIEKEWKDDTLEEKTLFNQMFKTYL
ncbi:MAG: hypothetical protein ACK5MK_07290 [Dysgonomonas sp.]